MNHPSCIRLIALCFLLFASSRAPAQESYRVRDYLPLVDGSEWVYRDNNGDLEVVSVRPGTEYGFDAAVKNVEDSFGNRQFYRIDSEGLTLVRYDEAGEGWIEFTPALKIAGTSMQVGQTLTSSGTVSVTLLEPAISVALDYNGTTTVDSVQRVTVPAGTFDTVKITLTFSISGNIQGEEINETESESLWLAKFIGPVMSELDGDVSRLVNVDSDGDGQYNVDDDDIDGDGLANVVETANGLNPLNPADAGEDNDSDGLDNRQEIRLGTALNNADTDGDGIDDGTEVARGSNPVVDERAVVIIINSFFDD